jgi:hypothetical protein
MSSLDDSWLATDPLLHLNTPLHLTNSSQSHITINSHRPVWLGVKPLLGPNNKFLLLSGNYSFAFSDERTGLSFVAVIASSICHLYVAILIYEFRYNFCDGVNSVFFWLGPINLSQVLLKSVQLTTSETETESETDRVRVTLRLAVYHQSVRLADKPLEVHEQSFFQLGPCGNSPYVISSLTRGWVCLLWIGFAFCQECVSYMSLKTLLFALYTGPLSVQTLQSRSCLFYLSYATTAA